MDSAKMGVYTKTDFAMAYGVTRPLFEKWIEPIKQDIGWRDGQRQKFPPRLVKIVFDYLGEPK
ncbi:hypothetical protein [Spirosoma endophyticum]|uniref:Uncharacterized protein n=1 Tax=Spirosoma endophyticum TaxID=662367 RepID=A0A1I1UCK6_9BACT|nr:hypothetical protein [Spirosoma endophyticum]SFD67328.1 hypothetical protein SAMN05216167_106175 [Spirosoma endophyticum]